MTDTFIPDTFIAPMVFNSKYFHFTVLEDALAKYDYEAIMSSQASLKGIFGPESEWPKSNMTLAENTASLKIHKQEFESGDAFSYAVFDHLKNKYLGCVLYRSKSITSIRL